MYISTSALMGDQKVVCGTLLVHKKLWTRHAVVPLFSSPGEID